MNQLLHAPSLRSLLRSIITLVFLGSVYAMAATALLTDLTVDTRAGEFQISAPANPASARVVFLSETGVGGALELWSVPVGGGTRVKLSGSLVSGGVVADFVISPDGSTVVFRADKEFDNRFELYIVPINGSSVSAAVSGTINNDGDVTFNYKFSSDSQRLVFIAQVSASAKQSLYSVNLSSGIRTSIAIPSAANGRVESFQIAPNNQRVVFYGSYDTDGVDELYSAPIAAFNTVIRLSPTLLGGSVGSTYRISNDSSRVVLTATSTSLATESLRSVPIDGGTSVAIAAPVVSGGDIGLFRISSDDQYVVFSGRRDNANRAELFSTRLASSDVVKISGTVVQADTERVGTFSISPDANHVYFFTNSDAEVQEIYSVPIRSTTPALLSGNIASTLQTGSSPPVAANSSRVIFSGFADDTLYSATPGTPAIAIAGLNGVNVSTSLNDFVIDSVSRNAAFYLDKDVDGVDELFVARIDGTAVTQITRESAFDTALTGMSRGDILFSPSGNHVVFGRRVKQTDKIVLMSAALNEPTLALDIDGDGKVLALTDGLLLTRYLLGIRGGALITNALGIGATRNTSFPVEKYLRQLVEGESVAQ